MYRRSKTQDLKGEHEIRAALLKRVKVYSYIHPEVGGEYAHALFAEYRKASLRKSENKTSPPCVIS